MKTLLLIHESVQFSFYRPDSYSDQVSFSTFDELPALIDPKVYNGIIFLKRTIDIESVHYIRVLQENGFSRAVHMLGTPVSEEVYRMILKDDLSDVAEISPFPEIQLQNLVLRRYHAQMESAGSYWGEVLFQLEHVPALRINPRGMILKANEALINHFRFNVFNLEGKHLTKLIPDYTVEQILSHFRQPQTRSLSGRCNFFDAEENIIPIRYTSLLLSRDELILTIEDLSQLVRLKRQADRLNQQLVQEHQLLDRLLTESLSISDELMELLQQVFVPDRVFRIAVEQETRNKRLSTSIVYPVNPGEELPDPFLPYLLDAYRTDEVTILHFSVNNKNHQDIALWAQTAILIPVKREMNPFVFLFIYKNHFEPDSFTYALLRYIKSLLGGKSVTGSGGEESDFFHTFMDNAREGMYKSTLDGHLVYANPAFLNILGYDSIEELKNITIPENIYINPQDREELLAGLRKSGYVDFVETVLRTKSGEKVQVQESASLYRDAHQGVDYITGIIRDVSVTRALEDQLKNNSRLITDIIDYASILIAGFSEGQWLIWNKKMEHALGYDKQAFRDFGHMINTLVEDGRTARFYNARMSEYLTGGSDEPVEMNLKSRTGLPLSISWTASYSEINGQEITIFFGVDVTRARIMERRIRETENMQLMSNMSNRIADVFQKYFEDMTHKLGDYKTNADVDKEQLIEIISQGFLEGNRIAEQVAKLSKASRPINEILLKPNLAVEHSIQILKTTMPESIDIHYSLGAHGQIRLEESLLTQIMLNLALNAASAMRDGGTLYIETRVVDAEKDDFLRLNIPPGQKYFNLVFRDTGSGMDDETREKIFEPFFTTSTGKAVKGLGATYIYFIVKTAHGFIDVQSAVGEGTVIKIYFPLISDKAQTKTIKSGKTPTILVVDDQLTVRELMKDIFVADGYNVLEANNGEDGLRIYKENRERVDLVIVDIIMPKMNGAELYFALHELNPRLPILITSGYSDEELKRSLIEHGARGYIPKPPDVAKLRTQINEILQVEEKIAK